MEVIAHLPRVLAIGVAATALMDLGLLLQKRLGMPTLDFGLLGRWAGHLLQGRILHPAIRLAAPVRGERGLGWALHYAIGIVFAALLVAWQGEHWLRQPSPGPALLWGLITVIAPFFILQPAMGAGIASSRTPMPWRNRLRSLMNHALFGLGLYLSAAILVLICR